MWVTVGEAIFKPIGLFIVNIATTSLWCRVLSTIRLGGDVPCIDPNPPFYKRKETLVPLSPGDVPLLWDIPQFCSFSFRGGGGEEGGTVAQQRGVVAQWLSRWRRGREEKEGLNVLKGRRMRTE